MNLKGEKVVIIGGSSGIGLATAKLAKEQGADVTIASRSRDKLERAAEQLGPVEIVEADVAEEEAVQSVFAGLNQVDHVFVPAGTWVGGNIVESDPDELRRALEVRIMGAIYVVQSAAAKMTDGSITFMSGQLASRPGPGTAITASSNAAVEVLARTLALELAPIRVNAIAPGLIDTPILGEHRDAVAKGAAANLPAKRIGTAEEVAQAVLLLMTNGFITGEVLHIDGGGRFV